MTSSARKPAGLGLVVAAGGFGMRLGAGSPKQYLSLCGIPMLQRTVAVLDSCDAVDALVVVVNPEDVEYCRREIAGGLAKVLGIVGGGSERALSVRNGLEALAAESSVELLGTHDGARPLVSCPLVWAVRDALAGDDTLDGAILAEPASDTTKLVDAAGVVVGTPDRRRVWRAQTPQIFRRERLLEAYRRDDATLLAATDDASLVESLGGRVVVVPGPPENLKVTTPLDVRVAEAILAEREGS